MIKDKEKRKLYAREYMKEFRKTPEYKKYYRNYSLVRSYGITSEEYDSLLKAQDNKCLICKDANPKGKGVFHVDHDHATGKVRGLLCHFCNLLLGHAKESPDILNNAIEYLKQEIK